jgi:hypothetical protein
MDRFDCSLINSFLCNFSVCVLFNVSLRNRIKLRFRFMVFNVTFNNISVISWRSVLLVEETAGKLQKCRKSLTNFITFTSITQSPLLHSHLYYAVTSITHSPLLHSHLYYTVTSITQSPLLHSHLYYTVTSITQSPLLHCVIEVTV